MPSHPNNIQTVNGYSKDAYTYYPVLIVGAGESGIALGCRLKEALGFDQFRIFERQAGIGGTWWSNQYPGVACDVPAAFYSFSFSLNYKWTSLFPGGSEIVNYLHEVCQKYRIVDKIQLNTEVSEIRWLAEEELWEATLSHMATGTGDMSRRERDLLIDEKGRESVYLRQETVRARIVASCAGGLVEPNAWPSTIPGRNSFEGPVFHSARWDYNVDLNGKDVIVVGTGCSAAQFVPLLTKEPYNANSVTQVMRSPPWVVPRLKPPFGKEKYEKYSPKIFSRVPGLARLFRLTCFIIGEIDWFTLFPNSPFGEKHRKKLEAKLIKHMKSTVPEKYHEILTPDYSVGCKRRVFDAFWLPCFNDPKVELTTKPITKVSPKSVTIGPGRTHPDPSDTNSKVSTNEETLPADVIILGNGFEIQNWLHPLKVRGKDGELLQDVWESRGGAQAYMGNAMDGFPNFFIIFGPNTATGHSSVILASENMVEYSLKFIKKILSGDVKTAEVKKESEIAWTQMVQERLQDTVFNMGGCQNWYRTADGWNSTGYPYSQFDFTFRCMFPKWSDWDLQYTRKGLVKKRIRQALQVLALIAVILGIYQVGRTSDSTQDARNTIRRYAKQILFSTWDLVGRGINLVLFRMWNLAGRGNNLLPPKSVPVRLRPAASYLKRMNKDQAYQQGAEAQYPEDKRNESKKKHTRAKRSRYISIACNECKRRKIKCNGEIPCHRCGNLSLQCLYAPNCCSGGFKDSSEFRAMNTTIQNLQAQVESLYANLSAFHNSQDGHPSPYQGQSTYSTNTAPSEPHSDGQHPLRPSTPVRRRHRCFQGPTSSGFSFNVAKSSLQTMGITNPSLNSGEGQDCDDPLPKPTQQQRLSFASVASPTTKDPIWDIGRDEGIRLCNVYEEEIGMMYPMLDMEKLIAKAERFFNSTKSRRTTGQISTSDSGADCLRSTDVNILKMILATVLILEGGGQSETGRLLFESVRDTCESRLWEPVDTEGLILLVVIAQYRFQQGEEVHAYRIIGLAARMCFEMGLHRKEVLSRESQRADSYWLAPRLFWSIFVLDRRWSFGTGLPFAIQDADIDPHLPEPDASTPYLTAMIAYSRIASKVWRSITAPEGAGSEIKKDAMGYLDYEILQWQNSVPESLRFYPTADISDRGSPSRAQRRLQVILYLRMNQMRILIYRPVLHSVTSIMENRRYAQIVVEVAKDTIRVLTRLNNTTDIYRTQQVCFNHFLVSALAALFLAVSHAPVEFNQVVRDEFYMALDLVSGFSAQTYVSQRLWKTIKGLKEVGPRLGLVSRQPMTDFVDPHSSAAVAMAGLAGHRVDEMTAFPVTTSAAALSRSPISGQQMSYELTNLFEAAGGAGSFGSILLPATSQGGDGATGYVSAPGEETGSAASRARGNTTGEREYSKIMQELF